LESIEGNDPTYAARKLRENKVSYDVSYFIGVNPK